MSASKLLENNSVTYTWRDIDILTAKLAEDIKNGNRVYNTIIAVGRGGWVPGVMLSHLLNIRDVIPIVARSYGDTSRDRPTIAVDILFKTPLKMMLARGDILVVDDICDTGETVKAIASHIPGAKFACLLAKPKGVSYCEYHADLVPQDNWAVFPWETISIDY